MSHKLSLHFYWSNPDWGCQAHPCPPTTIAPAVYNNSNPNPTGGHAAGSGSFVGSVFSARSNCMTTATRPRSDIKDLKLAAHGKKRILWADRDMPVLTRIRERFQKEQPLRGLKMSACLHVTAE